MPSTQIEVYSREQGNRKFTFYVDEGNNLIAEITSTGETPQQLPIDGIPQEYLANLTEEKITKLKTAFEQYNFATQAGKILIMGRLNGGWGRNQHKGYLKKPSGEKVHLDDDAIDASNGSHIGGGTFDWAYAMGFGKILNPNCEETFAGAVIGKADNDVDVNPDTDPTNIKSQFAQSYHFSVLEYQAGCCGDTRLFHAVRYLARAICLFPTDPYQALHELGVGLHPLQDIFAHGDPFVSTSIDLVSGCRFFHHYDSEFAVAADDPTFIGIGSVRSKIDERFNQRYTNTKIMSFVYLQIFKHFASKNQPVAFDEKIKNEVELQSVLSAEEIFFLKVKLKIRPSDCLSTRLTTRKAVIDALIEHATDDDFKRTLRGLYDTIDLILNPQVDMTLHSNLRQELVKMCHEHVKMDPTRSALLSQFLSTDEILKLKYIKEEFFEQQFSELLQRRSTLTMKKVHVEEKSLDAGLLTKGFIEDTASKARGFLPRFMQTEQVVPESVGTVDKKKLPIIKNLHAKAKPKGCKCF